MKNIWVVEDDYLQKEFICKSIKENFNVTPIEVSSESEFRKRLDLLKKPYPDLIILDTMLPWAKVEANIPKMPKEVEEDSFYRAGIRCEKLIRNKGEIKKIPVIMYTNLVREDIQSDLANLDKGTIFLAKRSEIKELLDTIQKCKYHH